ncbi:uncharacterized protein TNCV_2263381 [Trichonephila clavipes]|nr:uncharacterized protein TNCV_2263381 [Trichonephila clavipes]
MGFPHTNTTVITAEIESGFVAKDDLVPFLESGFVTKDDLVPFRCSPVSSCVAPLQTEASRAAHVMGAAIPNVRQPGASVWFEKTQGPLVKVLPVPGWWPLKQLAVRVYFL